MSDEQPSDVMKECLSVVATGATAGAAIGGPIGAVAGAAVATIANTVCHIAQED